MIARIVKGLLALVFLIVVGIAGLFVVARFHDGPLALIPGGPLVAGELVTTPVADWSFAKDVQEVEMQLAYENSSRTTWILVKDGAAYIPCSLDFPPGKRWYKDAAQDGRATLRIEGRRYPVRLTKTDDPALAERMRVEVQRKYGRVPPGESGVWIFQIDSRSAES